jgi:hypothetical protein
LPLPVSLLSMYFSTYHQYIQLSSIYPLSIICLSIIHLLNFIDFLRPYYMSCTILVFGETATNKLEKPFAHLDLYSNDLYLAVHLMKWFKTTQTIKVTETQEQRMCQSEEVRTTGETKNTNGGPVSQRVASAKGELWPELPHSQSRGRKCMRSMGLICQKGKSPLPLFLLLMKCAI